MVMVMVMCNVNRPSHSEIQLFQNLTMKIHGQGHVCGQRWRSRLTFKIHRSRSWPRSNLMVTFEALEFNQYVCFFVSWQSDHFWLRYSKFYIWPWKFKVKVMAKVKPDHADGHIWAIEFNRYVCFSFRGNRTIFGWDIAILYLTLKIQGQCKGQGKTRWSHLSPRVQSICLLFVSWQSDHSWLRYSKFHIWPWKYRSRSRRKSPKI